ncbi:MAG: histidinol-phosphatase HisJ family protein [Eubacteriales bacterium]|nr:histidinol-phosphatase HisJ family protein [Eubacteriales bacterium]
MIDSHIHSTFSTDSRMPAEAAIIEAIKKGLDGVVFTEHLDYDYPGYESSFQIDYDAYFSEMERLRKKYGGRIRIYAGLEAGIQPHVAERTANTLAGQQFDFIIASIHIIKGMDPYSNQTLYNGREKHDVYSEYLMLIDEMLNYYHVFDALGHFDYITRYAPYEDVSIRYEDYSSIFDSIFNKLISKGNIMEINTASYREKPGRPSPAFDTNILIRYREMGGKTVSLGSDAHETQYLNWKFSEFERYISAAGLNVKSRFR